jgi:hypothetical protein
MGLTLLVLVCREGIGEKRRGRGRGERERELTLKK